MANNVCVFCGGELPRFGRKNLYCCGYEQPTCKDCFAQISALPPKEQSRRALASGRAVAADKLRRALEQQEAEWRQKREGLLTDKTCPRCGGAMLKMGQQQFQLGEHTLFLGDLSHMMAGSLTLDLVYCETCRKVEFFLPEDFDLEEF